MFNSRMGEPKVEEPNGNDHHVAENGKKNQNADQFPYEDDI